MLWIQIPTLCIFVNRILLWCVMFFLNFTFIEMKITLNKTGTLLQFSFQIAKFQGIKLNGKFEQQNLMGNISYPPASEASREVANLNERKNTHTPLVDRMMMTKSDL